MTAQQEALQSSLKLHVEDLLRLMPDAFLILQGTQVVWCNQKAADFFGYDLPESMLYQSFEQVSGSDCCHDLQNGVFSSGTEPIRSGFMKEMVLHNKNHAVKADVYHSLLSGGFVMLLIKDSKDSGDEHGRLITQLKENQEILDKAKVQLVSQEKMATLGQLITGIVHEIFNPLGFIMSNIDTMKTYHRDLMYYMETIQALIDSSEDEMLKLQSERLLKKIDIDFIRSDTTDMFGDIDEGISRINAIIKGLKYFSRQQADVLDYDLNNGIQTSLIIAKNEYKYVADIVTLLENIPTLEADGNRINQVILNMIINAAHAIKSKGEMRKGTIQIKTYKADKMVVMEIADTGVGVPDANKNMIFEPFFTTKAEGFGTGLGLSIAYDIIVEQHKGKIEFTSEVGVGTTFIVSLPIERGEEQEDQHA